MLDNNALIEDCIIKSVVLISNVPQYTGNDDMFSEDIAYLDGRIWGIRRINPNMAGIWDGFEIWLSEKLNYALGSHWATEILRIYPKDNDAFHHFHLLFREYLYSDSCMDSRWKTVYDDYMQEFFSNARLYGSSAGKSGKRGQGKKRKKD